MRSGVFGSDSPVWLELEKRVRGADVYHGAAYHRVAEANGDGEALLFVAEEADRVLIHPFLRRPIDRVGTTAVSGGWCDLESVYGYVGPLGEGLDPGFVDRAWAAFDDWCSRERVVAEFVRFNPLLENERLAPASMEVVLDRETVVLRLPPEGDQLWASYPSVQRNMVRKAEAAGLVGTILEPEEGIGVFRELYAETMERVGADPYYRFGDWYFASLVSELAQRLRVVVVTGSEGVAAAALLLAAPPRLHYHLSASRPWAASLGAGNLLLHTAAGFGVERGYDAIHLGGGRTAAPDDSLLRFKLSVSRQRAPFYTGRRVHDAEAYRDLCTLWRGEAAREAPPFFLLYRLPVA